MDCYYRVTSKWRKRFMRIKEVKVYKFNELNDKAKRYAIDKYREHDDFSHSADYVIEDATAIGKLMGIDIEKIYYSGFCSQGDGACFIGNYHYREDSMKLVKEYAPVDERLHDIALLFDLCKGVSAKIKHPGHYYHSGCMDISVYSEHDDGYVKSKEDEILVDALKAYADWIYRSLEKEYEYQNSDVII